MIKVITGAPRAGKTYYAVREIVLKNYDWDKQFHEWKLKPGITDFTIITNIDGLKLPHVLFDQLLEDDNVSIHEFFTLYHFDNVLLPRYGRILLLLDEAHGYLPNTFKELKDFSSGQDKSRSVFYFFGYHGHRPVDMYFITHHWTDLPSQLTHKVEYQIEAVRRTMSVMGEFRYHFKNGMEVIRREVLKPDASIFALYKSSDGELHVNKQIRPLQKWLVFFLVVVVVMAFSLYSIFSRFLKSPAEQPPSADRPRAGAGAGKQAAGAGTGVKLVQVNAPPVVAPPVKSAPSLALNGAAPAETKPRGFSQIRVGGAWVGDDVVAIDLHGQLVPVADFPFSWSVAGEGRARVILATVPTESLTAIRGAIWLDSTGVVAEPEVRQGEAAPGVMGQPVAPVVN